MDAERERYLRTRLFLTGFEAGEVFAALGAAREQAEALAGALENHEHTESFERVLTLPVPGCPLCEALAAYRKGLS